MYNTNERNQSILLFDLGDTLIFRERNHYNLDLDLLEKSTSKDKESIIIAVKESLIDSPGIYKPWLENEKNSTLNKESFYISNFFTRVLSKLNSKNHLQEFLNLRSNQKRYFLFKDVKKILETLEKNHTLGILSNGRPSRREILKQLDINKYFDPKLIFISDEIQQAKPNRGIFHYVQEKIKSTYNKSKITLIDDDQDNINVAKQFGWKTLQVSPRTRGLLDIINLL